MTTEPDWAPYSLLTEPWLPVLLTDGTDESLGLLELFDRAPQVARIVGELPTVSAAIEGLVQAIYRRVTLVQYGTDRVTQAHAAAANWDDWEPIAQVAGAYLEMWAHRFDLRHPREPFYQVANLETTSGKSSGLEVLFADVPNGSPFLTMRRERGLESMSWDEAARWLVHAQAFDTSGIRSAVVGDKRGSKGKTFPIGPGWAAQLGILTPRVGNLAHDLILASVPTGVGQLAFDAVSDIPVWERPPHSERPEGVPDHLWESGTAKEIRDVRRPPTGPCDVLTWQSRRIRLIGDGAQVTGLVLTQGDPLDPQNAYSFEPRTAWRFSAPQTRAHKQTVYMPRELPPGSSLWRGVESVFPTSIAKETVRKGVETPRFHGPAHSHWIGLLENPNVSGRKGLVGQVELDALGTVLGSQRAVIDDLTESKLVLPGWLLEEEAQSARVEVAGWVELAERIGSAVGRFAANLYGAAGAHDTDLVRDEARATFLAAAEPVFQQVLAQLSTERGAKLSEATDNYANALRDLAFEQRTQLLENADDAALTGNQYGNVFMTVGKAERFFNSEMWRLLGSVPAEPSND